VEYETRRRTTLGQEEEWAVSWQAGGEEGKAELTLELRSEGSETGNFDGLTTGGVVQRGFVWNRGMAACSTVGRNKHRQDNDAGNGSIVVRRFGDLIRVGVQE
jgi:hypothetical protein